jgi:hypothetical protein
LKREHFQSVEPINAINMRGEPCAVWTLVLTVALLVVPPEAQGQPAVPPPLTPIKFILSSEAAQQPHGVARSRRELQCNLIPAAIASGDSTVRGIRPPNLFTDRNVRVVLCVCFSAKLGGSLCKSAHTSSKS